MNFRKKSDPTPLLSPSWGDCDCQSDTPRRTIMRALICFFALLATPAWAAPWDEPFGDPAEILAAANAISPQSGQDLQILLEEAIYEVDEERRVHRRTRLVYQVHALDRGDSIRVWWSPWYKQDPQIQVRVILPDGSAQDLDPATLVPITSQSSGDVYSDTKGLEGPLPRLEVGAVVERVITTRAHRPYFEAGEVSAFDLTWNFPPQQRVVEIRTARGVKTRSVGYDLPPPKRSRGPGGVQIERYELGAVETPERISLLPRDTPPTQMVRFTTGTSWAAVAKAYHAQVEAQLTGIDLAEEAKAAAGDATDPLVLVQNVFDHVRRTVRYTGLEFGKNALVPFDPIKTLERGFGDCKDQSTLLVGLLREHGIDASLALLNAGDYRDIDPDLPGLKQFDHAIAYVPSLDLWLDPTDSNTTAGELRVSTEGRYALVADPRTRKLTKTKRRTAADNVGRIERDVLLLDERPGQVMVRYRPRGGVAQDFRDGWVGVADKDAVEYLEGLVDDTLGAKSLASWSVSNADAPHAQFGVDLEAHEATWANTSYDEAWGGADAAEVLTELPDVFDEEPSDPPRSADLEHQWPHRMEVVTRVTPPPGYELIQSPEAHDRVFGPATFHQSVAVDGDEQVLTQTFELGGGDRLTPAEVAQVREAAAFVRSLDWQWFKFEHRSQTLVNEGRYADALELVRAQMAAEPDNPIPRLREAVIWTAAGVPEASRAPLRLLADHEFLGERALRQLADSCDVGYLGVEQGVGWDRACAVETLTALLEDQPDDRQLWVLLAAAYEYDADGLLRGPHADPDKAAAALRKALEAGGSSSILGPLLTDLARSGDRDGLKDVERRWGDRLSDRDRVALRAATTGGEAASRLARSQSSSPVAAQQQVAEAYMQLISWDHFAEAASVLESVAGPGSPQELLDAIELTKKMAEADPLGTPEGPVGPVMRMFRYLILGSDAEDPGNFLASLDSLVDVSDATALREMRDAMGDGQSNFSNQGLMRMMFAVMETRVEPLSPSVSLVHLSAEDEEFGIPLILQKKGGRWLLAGSLDPDDSKYGLLTLLHSGEVKAVRAALSVVRDMWVERGAEDHPLVAHWNAQKDTRAGLERLLLLDTCPPEACAEATKRAQKGVEGELLAELQHLEAIRWAQRGEHEKALLPAMRAQAAGIDAAWQVLQSSHRELGDQAASDEAIAALEEVVGGPQYDVRALQLTRFGDLESLNALVESASEGDGLGLNNIAWGMLVLGDAERAVEVAERALKAAPKSRATMHTLATALADAGRAQEARQLMTHLRNLREGGGFVPEDFYIFGRIAEHYGAWAAAREAYAQLPRPDSHEFSSTWSLAQRRLEALPPAPAR